MRKLVEFENDFESELKLGDVVKAEDILKEDEFVDVVGTSKGKGFQGVVHRYHFQGVGGKTHGQHNRLRHPGFNGSILMAFTRIPWNAYGRTHGQPEGQGHEPSGHQGYP